MSLVSHISQYQHQILEPGAWFGTSLDDHIEFELNKNTDLWSNPKQILEYFVAVIDKSLIEIDREVVLQDIVVLKSKNPIVVSHDSYMRIADIFDTLDPKTQDLIMNNHPDKIRKDIEHIDDEDTSEDYTDTQFAPVDDITRPFSDSLLPPAMIEAGSLMLDRTAEDLQNYISGQTIDWDSGMVAVAIYRAMLAAQNSDDPQAVVQNILDSALDPKPESLTEKENFTSVISVMEDNLGTSDNPVVQEAFRSCIDLLKAAVNKLIQADCEKAVGKTYRHRTRGSEYEVLCLATFLTPRKTPVKEGDTLVIVQRSVGPHLAYPTMEFYERYGIDIHQKLEATYAIGDVISIPNLKVTYIFKGEISFQDSAGEGLHDGDTVVVYQAVLDDGEMWGRKDREFFDGRFEEL